MTSKLIFGGAKYLQLLTSLVNNVKPDEVRFATFGLYRRSFSPLIRLLEALNQVPEVSGLVGYTENNVGVILSIARLAPKINWRFRFCTHLKFFVARKDACYFGYLGSHNLSDSTYDDMSVNLSQRTCQEIFSIFSSTCVGSHSFEQLQQAYEQSLRHSEMSARLLSDAEYTTSNDTGSVGDSGSPNSSLTKEPSNA